MYHIIVDLEMNGIRREDPAGKMCPKEIIEIGAVMLDEKMNEVSSFRTYVKPEHNDIIQPQIERLTGITNEMVAEAPHFTEAFRMFTNWCCGTGNEIIIHSWSDSDYQQIRMEMLLKQYTPLAKEKCITDIVWSDFQKEFDDNIGFGHQTSLKNALDLAGITFQGRAHDGLTDARNTAELFRIYNDPEQYEKRLRPIAIIMHPGSTRTTFGSLFDLSGWEFPEAVGM